MPIFPDEFKIGNLLLRPLVVADAVSAFQSYAGNADAARYMQWLPSTSVGEVAAHIEQQLARMEARAYAIVRPNVPDVVLGCFDLRVCAGKKLDFGYVLTPSEWGKGLMTDVLTTVVDWALAQPDVWRIGSCCDIDNRASARVMEKAGLTCEGVLKRWLVAANLSHEPRDCISFARVR